MHRAGASQTLCNACNRVRWIRVLGSKGLDAQLKLAKASMLLSFYAHQKNTEGNTEKTRCLSDINGTSMGEV